VSHITIILRSVRPTGTATEADIEGVSTEIEYTPPDSATPAQIGNEVARMLRHVKKIEDPHED
jgi:hypothetical protein